MIISRTPLRISFVGGGSDMKDYYRYKQGAVISSAINKYIYITVNKKFDKKIRASYSQTEIVSDVSSLRHEYIKECLKYVGIKGGIEITSISDIPSEGTGLGSSCSFIVGLLNALYAFKGKYISPERLAQEACKIEIDILNKPIGKQDQYIAAYGGFQYIRFNPDESVKIDPIIWKESTKRKLQNRLLLFYTGITRKSKDILTVQKDRLSRHSPVHLSNMDSMVEITHSMATQLHENSVSNFGNLLDKNWILKQSMAEGISSSKINNWYRIAKNSGAEGGKILGAGGGGFLLLYALPKFHKAIKMALPELKPIDFQFEQQGSKIIFYNESYVK